MCPLGIPADPKIINLCGINCCGSNCCGIKFNSPAKTIHNLHGTIYLLLDKYKGRTNGDFLFSGYKKSDQKKN